jgi:transposase
LSRDEVQRRRDQTQRTWHRRAWDVIYTALADPRPAVTIAQHLGVSKDFVHQTISRYKRLGPDAFLGPGTGGRHHAYLTPEQETAFLAPFDAQAATGDIPTSAQIQTALETQLGHSVADTTVYRLLDRHGWRKVVPRPQHPQSSPEARATWKKTFPTR